MGKRSPYAAGIDSGGKDSFTLFYTANEKVSGMVPDGNGITTTPGSMGLVEVQLKKKGAKLGDKP